MFPLRVWSKNHKGRVKENRFGERLFRSKFYICSHSRLEIQTFCFKTHHNRAVPNREPPPPPNGCQIHETGARSDQDSNNYDHAGITPRVHGKRGVTLPTPPTHTPTHPPYTHPGLTGPEPSTYTYIHALHIHTYIYIYMPFKFSAYGHI